MCITFVFHWPEGIGLLLKMIQKLQATAVAGLDLGDVTCDYQDLKTADSKLATARTAGFERGKVGLSCKQ